MKKTIFLLFSILLIQSSFGEMEIVPKGISAFYDPEIAVESPAFKQFSGLLFRPYCISKNNRGTYNPLDPKAYIVTTITILGQSYDIRYKASIIKKKSKGNAGEIDYMVAKGTSSFIDFCNRHPKICKRPLPYTSPAIGTAIADLEKLIDDAFGGNLTDAFGQQYLARILGRMKSIYIDGPSNPAASYTAYEFVDFSSATKDFCKKGGASPLNPCYKNRMCQFTCALSADFNTCLTECKSKVTTISEATVDCKWRVARADKTSTSGYQDTLSCEPNTIHIPIPEELLNNKIKTKVKHFQHNGKTTPRPYAFYGWQGPMSDSKGKGGVKNRVIPAKKMARVETDFPGQDGFCGGFHSPLMVFFDNKRPLFNNVSKLLFKGEESEGLTYWTEKNHHGYYLAILDKGNGARKGIYRADQLFGDSDYYTGFEALEKHDSNEDGIINKKDKNFKRLVLWKDKNGDSRSQDGEIIFLKDSHISEFDLRNIDSTYKFFYGERATARGRSLFSYKKDGKNFTGFLVDIYYKDFYY